MPDISKDLIAATSIPLILSILTEDETYGYELIKKIKERSGGKLEFAEGTIYPVLKKLEEKKWISSKWKLGDTDRQRKYYRITSSGKKQLQTEKNNWLAIHNLFEQLWKTQINLSWK
jgi:PadR family transcriptional regulator, regulatory protein PadR